MIEPHRIAGQFFNRPLLLTETSARTISSFLLSRFEMRRGEGTENDSGKSTQAFRSQMKEDGSAEFHSPRASRFVGEYRVGADGRPLPYRVTNSGTAIITIIGELVNRGAWIGASSGLVSYEGIKHQVSTAANDPQVTGILLDIESPGGEAIGCFEAAKVIREAREKKPVAAIVNGMAASAAYAIAAAASRIYTMPTGLSGSIGVVMLHMDLSQLLADAGLKPTFIFAGAHKIDGNPYEPLPDDVRATFQAEIDAFYGLFVQTVAIGRCRRMTEQRVRETEARIFMGDDAVRLGLADEIATFDEVIATIAGPQFRSALVGRAQASSSGGKPLMNDETITTTAAAPPSIETISEVTENGAATTTAAQAPAATQTVADAFASVTAAEGTQAAVQATPAAAAAPACPAKPTASPAGAEAPEAIAAERRRAADLYALGTQAARLGVSIDVSKAIEDGTSVDALRKVVIDTAAARDEATAVVATTSASPKTAAGPNTAGGGLQRAAAELAAKQAAGR